MQTPHSFFDWCFMLNNARCPTFKIDLFEDLINYPDFASINLADLSIRHVVRIFGGCVDAHENTRTIFSCPLTKEEFISLAKEVLTGDLI